MQTSLPSAAQIANVSFAVPTVNVGVDIISKLVAVTGELFGGNVSIEEDHDPDFSDERYLVIAAETSLDPKSIVRAELAWIEILTSLAPNWHSVRLSIRPI